MKHTFTYAEINMKPKVQNSSSDQRYGSHIVTWFIIVWMDEKEIGNLNGIIEMIGNLRTCEGTWTII